MRLLHGHALRVNDVAFAPDGRTLASCSGDGTLRLWDLATGEGVVLDQVAERREFQTRRPVPDSYERLAFTRNGSSLVCRFAEGGVSLWDVRRRSPVAAILGSTRRGYRRGLAAARVGGRVAANEWFAEPFSNVVHLWDFEDQSSRVLFATPETSEFSGLAFDPSGTRLATNAGVFDVRTGERVLEAHLWGDELRWSPTGSLIAGACQYEGIQVIDAGTAEPVVSLAAGDSEPPRFGFSSCGRFFATTLHGFLVRVWETANWTYQGDFDWKVGRLTSLAFSPDGLLAACGTAKGPILLWDWDL
ncbi:MAG: WD40 repeat domain-containing protein [Gemmataceae bacterium]|nr:WD40 repeat domain-containing protein [Gemmataceae bacterium]